eukprot:TRINITY_DN92694_c0_g1_i1.p1 TRINITY_DN92694_c0_g1~~TRINITY_DN92694_c0_g1_i1.p1  ORF type:complete len:635 (-),score=92.02 TRINITY_DN92694_c0_g1_i1:178-2082(-)
MKRNILNGNQINNDAIKCRKKSTLSPIYSRDKIINIMESLPYKGKKEISPLADLDLLAGGTLFKVLRGSLYSASALFKEKIKANPKTTSIEAKIKGVDVDTIEDLLLLAHGEKDTFSSRNVAGLLKVLQEWQMFAVLPRFVPYLKENLTRESLLKVINVALSNETPEPEVLKVLTYHMEKTDYKDLMKRDKGEFAKELTPKAMGKLAEMLENVTTKDKEFADLVKDLKNSAATGCSDAEREHVKEIEHRLTVLEATMEQGMATVEKMRSDMQETLTSFSKEMADMKTTLKDIKEAQAATDQRLEKLIAERINSTKVPQEEEKKQQVAPMKDTSYTFYYGSGGNTVYLFDIKAKQSQKITFDYKDPGHVSSIIIGDQFYIIGGNFHFKSIADTYSVSIKPPVSHTAVKRAGLTMARDSIGLTGYKGEYIYAIGGEYGYSANNYQSTDYCEKYDIKKNVWTKIPRLNEHKEYVCACEMDDCIYAIGGYLKYSGRDENTDKIEVLNAKQETDGWKILYIEHLDQDWKPRYSCGGIKISEDKILIFGGYSSSHSTNSHILTKTDKGYTMKSTGSNTLEGGGYFSCQNTIVSTGSEIYATCYNNSNIHIYSIEDNSWKVIKSKQWKPQYLMLTTFILVY